MLCFFAGNGRRSRVAFRGGRIPAATTITPTAAIDATAKIAPALLPEMTFGASPTTTPPATWPADPASDTMANREL